MAAFHMVQISENHKLPIKPLLGFCYRLWLNKKLDAFLINQMPFWNIMWAKMLKQKKRLDHEFDLMRGPMEFFTLHSWSHDEGWNVGNANVGHPMFVLHSAFAEEFWVIIGNQTH